MANNQTFKEIIVTIWGDEFPIIERMSPNLFRHFFGTWPRTSIDKVTLKNTAMLANYVRDDHSTVLDCIVANINLKQQEDETRS